MSTENNVVELSPKEEEKEVYEPIFGSDELLSEILFVVGIVEIDPDARIEMLKAIDVHAAITWECAQEDKAKEIEKGLKGEKNKKGEIKNNYHLVRRGDQVDVVVSFKVDDDKQLHHVFEAQRHLRELGISFDTGFGFGQRDWELNLNYSGPIKVTFTEKKKEPVDW